MMKLQNLFISFGSEINLRNFGDGTFSCRKLNPTEVKSLIDSTRDENGKVAAYFEFGPVPIKSKNNQFRQLLDAFKKIVGVSLEPDMFMMERQDKETFPNLSFRPTAFETGPLLVVEYYFELDSERFLEEDVDDAFSVSASSMDFYCFTYESSS